MKIINLPPNRMIIRTKPVLLWLFGTIFGLVGLFLVAFLGKETTFNCQRLELNADGNCVHISSSLVTRDERSIKISDIIKARVEEYSDSDGDTYKVIIETENGSIPFTSSSSSGYSDKKELADQINNFINDKSQKDLFLRLDDRFLIGIIGGVFGLVGLICIVFVCQISIYIDKGVRKVRIVKQNLIRKHYIEFNFDEIQDIYVDESSDSDGTTYRVAFKATSGEKIPLTAYYSSGFDDKNKLALSIKKFIFNKES